MASLQSILKSYWGYDSFRPMQEEIMQSVLDGQDTLALMPTGGGKSLCYQVPAMAREGLCLVISPLIALMKDQVENLRRRNITAYAIYSGMTRQEVLHTLKTVINSNCKFLYVSPERLETELFREYLPGMTINLLAVDEAHCISQWGYDFRPPYLRIAALREELPGVTVLALTASATPEVQQDICVRLDRQTFPSTSPEKAPAHWKIFRQSFERANLSYHVFRAEARANKIIDVAGKIPGCGIVYCRSRKRTQEISDLLRLHEIAADFYHAGLAQEERTRKQEDWVANRTRVIVCTNAFGMGIDKPDVRFVIHADVPDCLENYYQEAGRAGRDGQSAYAILLYDEKELEDLRKLPELRYPPVEDIAAVYQASANYLQVPAGGGEGEYYDFDLGDFVKKFKLNGHTTTYSLKALEQEGWLNFNEQVFVPSRLRFTASKAELYRFETEHPGLDPLVKTLLRIYEGIFDYPTAISEMLIARTMRLDLAEVKTRLIQLDRLGLIDYQPQKDSPQLFFTRPRARQGELRINQAGQDLRRKKLGARIEDMIRYVESRSECRSQLIGRYFGDEAIAACGICDNCRSRKKTLPGGDEFDRIRVRIILALKKAPLETKDLLQTLADIETEKAWQVIGFLQEEEEIETDQNGRIRIREK